MAGKQRYYSTARLSERISETPEGFLICQDVAITRTGDLLYAPGETPVTPKAGVHYVTISRTKEDIHSPETIASFEGKSVTIYHPDDFVTPLNWKELTVGVIQNVRPGHGADEDKLMADLLITDREAIYAVKSKKLREVSCGYEAEYFEDSPGRGRQKNIIGNHVALVPAGRCGSECAIFDHAPQEKPMSLKDKIMAAFGKAIDEADIEKGQEPSPPAATADNAAILAQMTELNKGIGTLVAALTNDGKGTKADDAAAVAAKKAADEAAAAEAAKGGEENPMEKRLATIEAALVKLAGLGGEGTGSAPATVGDADLCKDADTLARAEILAPGLGKTVKGSELKAKAVDAAYATEDGKVVIDLLLGGKTLDSADKDILFNGAAEMLKGVRRQQFQTTFSLDQSTLKAGDMTPEKINQMNAERYGTK